MALVPEMTNEGTSSPGEPFFFPSYGNIGPPHIATLSLPGLTIGLSGVVVFHSGNPECSKCFGRKHLPPRASTSC
jgi:hypothetical protein